MKKLPPSGYVTAEESRKPGYLLAKFKRMQQAHKDNADEAKAKVQTLPRKVSHG